MSRIEKQDTQGTKPLLSTGELGYDNYPAGGDVGRVYVGTGTENVAIAKKSEVTVLDNKANAHIASVDNPHSVTKAQVGLGNADNTADVNKSVLSATKLTTPRSITISGEVAGSVSFDGSTDVTISTTIQPNSVALGVDTTGNYVSNVTAGSGITVSGTANEGWSPVIAITPIGSSGTYTKVSTNDKGQVVVGGSLSATDIPGLDASKITSGIIDAARLPAYVDDVLEYPTLDEFPTIGETGVIYIALNTNKAYRWSGSTYVYITSGAVDSVAGKTGVVTLVKSDVGLGNVDNTSDANKPISTATQTALNGKLNTNANAVSATKLATAIMINGVAFDGSANITITAAANGGTSAACSGNSATATKLTTARTINGVSFDGTANIVAPTNLAITAGTTAGPIVTSSTGTNATLPTASASASGVVTTGNQTWAGVKEFSSSPIVPTATTETQAVNKGQLDLKAPLESPTFTGTPKIGNNNITSISTSVTDNSIARYDSTTGKLQDSGVYIEDNNVIYIGGLGNAYTSISSSQFNMSQFNSTTNNFQFVNRTNGKGIEFYTTSGGVLQKVMEVPANGDLLLTSGTGTLGYGAGAGGTVTQLTSKSTDVTLNKPSGYIRMHNEALAAGAVVNFTLNNNLITVDESVIISIGGVNLSFYNFWCTFGSIGKTTIYVKNIGTSSLSNSISLRFAIIKGAAV